jgi:hypothetical protein
MKKIIALLTLTLVVGWMSVQSMASNAPAALLTRPHDPVVLIGDQLSNLLGTATDEIFVYAFTSSTAAQIPFQIDEQNVDGMFVPNGDGLFGNTEELVFMAADAGDYEPDPLLSTPGGDIYPDFVVTLTDPLSSEQAWAYIYSSPDLAQTFGDDYVSYDAGNDRITSPGLYSQGFNAINSFRDYVALGGGADLLDRDKARIDGTFFGIPFSLNEENISKDAVHAIDGPVRVTRVATSTISIGGIPMTDDGATFFYQGLITQAASFSTPLPPIVITYWRISFDWNASASGMTYYDSNNPAGVTIDGVVDTVDIDPVAEWQEVTGANGTMITTLDVPDSLTGASTYYKDNNTVDPNDTGDQMSYGDAGFQVNVPAGGQTYDLLVYTYFLTDAQPNVGATYFDYYLNPLDVQVAIFGLPTPTPTASPTATETPTPTLTPTATPPSPALTPWVYIPLVVR